MIYVLVGWSLVIYVLVAESLMIYLLVGGSSVIIVILPGRDTYSIAWPLCPVSSATYIIEGFLKQIMEIT